MKTLILGTSYVGDTAQKYGIKMVELWAKLAVHLNPECDILLVDSASPVSFDGLPAKVEVHRLKENPGHLNVNGVDGWGCAMSFGLSYAIANGYTYVAYMDSDIIVAEPVGPIIRKMHRSDVKAAIPLCQQYQFLENGIMFFNVDYLSDSEFVERYDWQSRKPSADPLDIPEMVTERLLADELWILPMRTFRDDGNILTVNNIEHLSPYGLDALTHTKYEVYEKFLELKGINL